MTNNKKFKPSLWIIFIFLFVMSACQKSSSQTVETALPPHEKQKSDFDFLEKGISYEEIVARIGKEDRDVGSGLYILEYNLADGSRVYLQFSSLESLDRAVIEYPDGHGENILGQ